MSINQAEIQQVVARWKAETQNILEAKVNKKKLRESGSLAQSTGNIVWRITADQIIITVTIAEHGRFLDMRRLNGKKNRNRWGYAKALWGAVSVLEDEITILLANQVRNTVMDAFRGIRL